MSASFAIEEIGGGDAADISGFATMAYVAAFGADFDDPEDLRHHLATGLSVEAWRRYLAVDRVFVARSGAQIIGFAQIGDAEHRGDLELRRLYVDPHRQSEGIGAALMTHALADPAVAAVPAVWLDVWQDNDGAQRFYRRFGFELTGDKRPFVLKSGRIDGYDLVMVRRRPGP